MNNVRMNSSKFSFQTCVQFLIILELIVFLAIYFQQIKPIMVKVKVKTQYQDKSWHLFSKKLFLCWFFHMSRRMRGTRFYETTSHHIFVVLCCFHLKICTLSSCGQNAYLNKNKIQDNTTTNFLFRQITCLFIKKYGLYSDVLFSVTFYINLVISNKKQATPFL